jgi:hypothetical protein
MNFTAHPLFPRRRSPRYPLDRMLDGPQYRPERFGEEKNILTLPEIESRTLGSPVRSLVSVPTQLSLFSTKVLKS